MNLGWCESLLPTEVYRNLLVPATYTVNGHQSGAHSQPVASTRRGLSLQAPEQTRNVSTTTMAMTVNSPEYAFTYVGSPGSDAAKVDPCYTR